MTLYRAATVLLILGLFTVGSIPTAGQAFPGTMHWVAHVSTYALIAFVWGIGWRGMQAISIAAIVTAIGVCHELTEIITHNHDFEYMDAVVNGLGALAGVAILTGLRKFLQKKKAQDNL